jgi:hypothetical protein
MHPLLIHQIIRIVKTRVLPEPAPAIMIMGPSFVIRVRVVLHLVGQCIFALKLSIYKNKNLRIKNRFHFFSLKNQN